MQSCLKYVFGFQFETERNVFSRYFAGFDVWTAFEISRLIFAGGRLSQIIMSDRSKAGVEFCTQRELKGADNQVQKYANAIIPFYTENLHMNDIQNIYMKNGKKCKKSKKIFCTKEIKDIFGNISPDSFDIVYRQTFLRTNYNFSCLLLVTGRGELARKLKLNLKF